MFCSFCLPALHHILSSATPPQWPHWSTLRLIRQCKMFRVTLCWLLLVVGHEASGLTVRRSCCLQARIKSSSSSRRSVYTLLNLTSSDDNNDNNSITNDNNNNDRTAQETPLGLMARLQQLQSKAVAAIPSVALGATLGALLTLMALFYPIFTDPEGVAGGGRSYDAVVTSPSPSPTPPSISAEVPSVSSALYIYSKNKRSI